MTRRRAIAAARSLLAALALSACLLPAVGARTGPEARELFDAMAAAIDKLSDYEADWEHYTATPGKHPIHGQKKSSGKFLRNPALCYDNILVSENNYYDPLTPATQMIHDSRTRELLILLPGGRRLLGVIHVFEEDAKNIRLNRESLKREPWWEQLEIWRSKLEKGSLALSKKSWDGKQYKILALSFPVEDYGTRPEIGRYDIWVNPADNLPRRCQGYVKGQDKPVYDYKITRLEANKGITADDVKFQGLALWSFPAQFVANAEGLDKIKWNKAPGAKDAEPPSFASAQRKYRAAIAGIGDYRAELTVTQKYFRIKSAGKIGASVIREPRFFLFEIGKDYRVNHLGMIAAGTRVCYYRDQKAYASLGGGAMRVVGVQLMHVDDLRSDFVFGESWRGMNLFELEKRMKWYMQNGDISVEMVNAGGKTLPRLIMKRKTEPRPAQIQHVAVILGPDWLPVRVEYFGNGDHEGFAIVEYNSIKTNLGLKEEDLKF